MVERWVIRLPGTVEGLAFAQDPDALYAMDRGRSLFELSMDDGTIEGEIPRNSSPWEKANNDGGGLLFLRALPSKVLAMGVRNGSHGTLRKEVLFVTRQGKLAARLDSLLGAQQRLGVTSMDVAAAGARRVVFGTDASGSIVVDY